MDSITILILQILTKKELPTHPTSFGHEVSFTPLEKVAGVTRELQKFDAISVREESGVRVLKG